MPKPSHRPNPQNYFRTQVSSLYRLKGYNPYRGSCSDALTDLQAYPLKLFWLWCPNRLTGLSLKIILGLIPLPTHKPTPHKCFWSDSPTDSPGSPLRLFLAWSPCWLIGPPPIKFLGQMPLPTHSPFHHKYFDCVTLTNSPTPHKISRSDTLTDSHAFWLTVSF